MVKKERISERHTIKKIAHTPKTQTTPQKHILMNSNETPTWPCINGNAIAIISLLTSHARVSTEATVELTVHQSSVEKPLAEQVKDAVDLWPCRGWQGPRLPTALVGTRKQGRGGRSLLLLLLLLLGCFGWLTTTALQGGEGKRKRSVRVVDNTISVTNRSQTDNLS